ncbi:MAG TPA: YfiR family protein [Cyclobacteriaceae bacterium]|nr:YfiR family protein [Cyclobacteriaceae bacterium]
MKVALSLFTFLITILLCSFRQSAPDPDINAKTKTLFIYNFTKYVEWPESMKTGSFVIGIYGDYPNLLAELQNMASTKTAGSQKITIIQYSSVETIVPCHLIYVNEDKAGELPGIIKKLGDYPTLVVTDAEGSAKKGACINFYYEASKQRMEVNPETIRKRDLKISGQLLSLAKVVQ